MINLSQWDAEIQAIAADLAAMKNRQQNPQQNERMSLIGLKVGIFQLQARLSTILDKIANASKRTALIADPKAKSLLHWAGIYAHKAHDYYFQLAQLFGKRMWLKLIRTRTPGFSAAPSMDFTDEHLIELSIRHKQLVDTESALREELLQLGQHKQQLKHRYDDICAIKANRDAAGSMQAHFGRNPHEALSHPVIGRIKSAFLHLSHAARPVTSKYSYVMDIHQDVSERVDRMIQHCKSIVLSDLHNPDHGRQRVANRELDGSLREISDLREQLSIAEGLFNTTPEAFHPKLKRPVTARKQR